MQVAASLPIAERRAHALSGGEIAVRDVHPFMYPPVRLFETARWRQSQRQ